MQDTHRHTRGWGTKLTVLCPPPCNSDFLLPLLHIAPFLQRKPPPHPLCKTTPPPLIALLQPVCVGTHNNSLCLTLFGFCAQTLLQFRCSTPSDKGTFFAKKACPKKRSFAPTLETHDTHTHTCYNLEHAATRVSEEDDD